MTKLNKLFKCNYDVNIEGISVNSKDTHPGDLFVCIKGATVDRHDFIEEAIKNGAVALVTSHEVESSVPYVVVDNPNNEVSRLAKLIYDNPSDKLHMLGVTGTDGKTSVSTIVSKLIGQDKCGYMGTNGYSTSKFNRKTDNTTPSADKLYKYLDDIYDAGCDSVCMELSSEAMLFNRINDLSFDVIGLTNITSEHLNNHKTLENYIECKKKILGLVKRDGYVILNHDDKHYKECRDYVNSNILTYGKDYDCDLQIVDYNLMVDKTEITYKYKNKTYNITSPLVGEFNVYNLACAILMCIAAGYDIEMLISNTKLLHVDGRMEFINLGQNFSVIVDYAHTEAGITKLLEFIHSIKYNHLIVVIGQAGERDQLKRRKVGKIVATNADLAIFCYEDPRSEDPADIIDMMTMDIRNLDNYKIIIDRREAINYAINNAHENDIVLVLGKGNEDYQKLKTGTIHFNDIEECKKALNNLKVVNK